MRRFRDLLPDIIIITLLFLLPLGFFAQQTIGGKTLIPTENLYQYEPYATYSEVVGAPDMTHNHLVSDLVLQNYQWKSFTRTQLAQGEVPLWNGHQFAGIPFLAAGQHSALYPLSIVYYTMPLPMAYGWFTVINLWLAGVFMYAFARGLGIGRAGSMLAGIVYQFNGFVIASVVFQMMIGGLPWLPLILLMLEFILREKPLFGQKTVIGWVAIGAVALAMNILAGHIEITIYSLLIAGYYAAWRWANLWWRQHRDWRKAAKQAGWMLTLVILGVGLAAIQFIPLYDFVQENWRSERGSYQSVVELAHVPRDILQFALPNFYGNPAHHQYLDIFSGEIITNFTTGQNHTDWAIKNYVEAALYLGILPLLLSVFALIDRVLYWRTSRQGSTRRPEPPYRRLFAVLALLSLTFMFGLPTYRIIYALPGINQLNSAFRWIYALSVCVAILSAFGLDALLRRSAEKRTPMETRLGYVLCAGAIAIFIGLAGSYIFFEQLEPLITRIVGSLAKADQAFDSARMFYSYQFINVLIFGVMLLLSGIVFAWVGRMRMYRGVTVWSIFAVTIVAVDLMIASWGFNPASDPALLDFTPPAVEWLAEQYDPQLPTRYTSLEPKDTTPILNANSTWRYGLDDIRGYDSIIPKPYVDYMRDLAPQAQLDFNRIAPIFTNPDYYTNRPSWEQSLNSPMFHALNVRYVVTPKDFVVPFSSWELPYEDEAVRIWENPHALPRVWTIAPNDLPETWLDNESAPQFSAPAEGVLPFEGYETQQITRNTQREKFIDLTLDSDQWLIISENYADGWKAFIRPQGADDNQETQLDVQRIGRIFQGVHLDGDEIEAGEYTIRFVYSPTSFQVGFFGSAISAAILSLMVGMWFWQTYVGLNTEDSSQTAKVTRNSLAPIILNLFNRGIDFVLAMIIYRLLSQEGVGVYNLAIQVFLWFEIFTNFGLDLLLIREVSRDKKRGGFYVYNTSVLRLGLSVIGIVLLALFLIFWQSRVPNPLPPEGIIAISLLYIGLFPASLNKGVTSLYYAHEQAEKPAAIATITTINRAVLSVVVLAAGWGIIGLAGVSILNNVITLGVLLWFARGFIGQHMRWKPDFKLMREMTRESYPLLLNHFLATIFFQIDIVILQAMRGAVVQAQYSTSYKWLNALNIVPSFFTQALFPLMSRQAQEDKHSLKLTYQFGIKLLFALTLPVAIGFFVMAETLTLILAGQSYLPDAAIALQIMIWSIPIGWINSLTQYALIALNLQRFITRAFFVAVAFNIITNLIFIPQFGFRAAAITTILSEAALLIPFGLLMHRGLGEPVNWVGAFWKPAAAGVAMFVLVWALPVPDILAVIVGGVAYVVILLALKPLEPHEVDRLPERIRNLPVLRLSR